MIVSRIKDMYIIVSFPIKWEDISKNWGMGIVCLIKCSQSKHGDFRGGVCMKLR
jgi:hypothetical protein